MKHMHLPQAWTDNLVRPKQLKIDLQEVGWGGGEFTHTPSSCDASYKLIGIPYLGTY